MKALSSAERDLVRSIDLERLTDDLQTLVRIRSDTGEEAAAQQELAHRMAAARLNVVQTVADPAELTADPDFPGMEVERTTLPIVAGHLGNPTSGGRRVMIAGHIDTVPPGDRSRWTTDPFGGDIRDGKLYGRGAADMKGGLIAGLAAVRAISEHEAELAGQVTLLSVPSEEDGGTGMLAAIRAGYTADMAVITEPTHLDVVTAQAGAVTFRITVPGRSTHAAFRLSGVSAIEKAYVLHQALLADERRRNDSESDPTMRALRLPYPTNVGVIHGGEWSSTVPEHATIEGRYGVRIGETLADAEKDLRTAIATACEADEWLSEHRAVVEISGGRFASANVPITHDLPASLRQAAGDTLGRRPDFTGVPYGADMRLLVHQGATPTVLYGPGDARTAHSTDEHVSLRDVAACARTLAVWVVRMLARAGSVAVRRET